MIRRHVCKEGADEQILRHVFAIEDTCHAQQSGKSACPLKKCGFVCLRCYGVVELRVPVHTATEWFVLRMSASAQTEMLPRRTLGSGHIISKFVDKSDTACNPVRTIFGNLHRRRSMPIDLVAGFHSFDAVTEGSRRARPHGLDYFVQSSTARSNELLLPNMEYRS